MLFAVTYVAVSESEPLSCGGGKFRFTASLPAESRNNSSNNAAAAATSCTLYTTATAKVVSCPFPTAAAATGE